MFQLKTPFIFAESIVSLQGISKRSNEVLSLNPAHDKVYSIQHYVIKFVSDLRHGITEILLKVVLNTITLILTLKTINNIYQCPPETLILYGILDPPRFNTPYGILDPRVKFQSYYFEENRWYITVSNPC